MVDSNSLISPLSLSASALTLLDWALIAAFWSSSPLIRALVSFNCFSTSFFIASILFVLSMISWTADPPLWRARTYSFFAAQSLSCSAMTLLHSATALSILASAIAIFSSYSALYCANFVHLRLGLTSNHSCHHSQVLPMCQFLMVRCKQ